jgi:uridine kinase
MKRPFIIGIAGGSASGKSTFCDSLEKRISDLQIKVFHMDSYFRPEDDRPRSIAPVSGKTYIDDNHPLTMDLQKLNEDLTNAMESRVFDVIIVEGLLTLWDKDICGRLDLRLFVDCRADERIVRRIKRNMQWGLQFDEISGVYLDLVRYRHDEYVEPTKWKADFILNGSAPSELALSIISDHVRRSVPR